MTDIITDTPPCEALTAQARTWIAAGALAAALAAGVATLPQTWLQAAPTPPPGAAPVVAAASPSEAPVILSGPVVTTQVLVRPHPAPTPTATAVRPARSAATPHHAARPQLPPAPHARAPARPQPTSHARPDHRTASPAARPAPHRERPKRPRSWKD